MTPAPLPECLRREVLALFLACSAARTELVSMTTVTADSGTETAQGCCCKMHDSAPWQCNASVDGRPCVTDAEFTENPNYEYRLHQCLQSRDLSWEVPMGTDGGVRLKLDEHSFFKAREVLVEKLDLDVVIVRSGRLYNRMIVGGSSTCKSTPEQNTCANIELTVIEPVLMHRGFQKQLGDFRLQVILSLDQERVFTRKGWETTVENEKIVIEPSGADSTAWDSVYKFAYGFFEQRIGNYLRDRLREVSIFLSELPPSIRYHLGESGVDAHLKLRKRMDSANRVANALDLDFVLDQTSTVPWGQLVALLVSADLTKGSSDADVSTLRPHTATFQSNWTFRDNVFANRPSLQLDADLRLSMDYPFASLLKHALEQRGVHISQPTSTAKIGHNDVTSYITWKPNLKSFTFPDSYALALQFPEFTCESLVLSIEPRTPYEPDPDQKALPTGVVLSLGFPAENQTGKSASISVVLPAWGCMRFASGLRSRAFERLCNLAMSVLGKYNVTARMRLTGGGILVQHPPPGQNSALPPVRSCLDSEGCPEGLTSPEASFEFSSPCGATIGILATGDAFFLSLAVQPTALLDGMGAYVLGDAVHVELPGGGTAQAKSIAVGTKGNYTTDGDDVYVAIRINLSLSGLALATRAPVDPYVSTFLQGDVRLYGTLHLKGSMQKELAGTCSASGIPETGEAASMSLLVSANFTETKQGVALQLDVGRTTSTSLVADLQLDTLLNAFQMAAFENITGADHDNLLESVHRHRQAHVQGTMVFLVPSSESDRAGHTVEAIELKAIDPNLRTDVNFECLDAKRLLVTAHISLVLVVQELGGDSDIVSNARRAFSVLTPKVSIEANLVGVIGSGVYHPCVTNYNEYCTRVRTLCDWREDCANREGSARDKCKQVCVEERNACFTMSKSAEGLCADQRHSNLNVEVGEWRLVKWFVNRMLRTTLRVRLSEQLSYLAPAVAASAFGNDGTCHQGGPRLNVKARISEASHDQMSRPPFIRFEVGYPGFAKIAQDFYVKIARAVKRAVGKVVPRMVALGGASAVFEAQGLFGSQANLLEERDQLVLTLAVRNPVAVALGKYLKELAQQLDVSLASQVALSFPQLPTSVLQQRDKPSIALEVDCQSAGDNVKLQAQLKVLEVPINKYRSPDQAEADAWTDTSGSTQLPPSTSPILEWDPLEHPFFMFMNTSTISHDLSMARSRPQAMRFDSKTRGQLTLDMRRVSRILTETNWPQDFGFITGFGLLNVFVADATVPQERVVMLACGVLSFVDPAKAKIVSDFRVASMKDMVYDKEFACFRFRATNDASKVEQRIALCSQHDEKLWRTLLTHEHMRSQTLDDDGACSVREIKPLPPNRLPQTCTPIDRTGPIGPRLGPKRKTHVCHVDKGTPEQILRRIQSLPADQRWWWKPADVPHNVM